MAQSSRTPPLERIRDAIEEALWSAVSAYDLPAVCVRLGLSDGTSGEAMGSKRKYVRARITTFKGAELMALAQAILEEFEVSSLRDFLSELTTHAEHRITDLTRRSVLDAFDSLEDLFGKLPLHDGLGVLAPSWQEPSKLSDPFGGTLADDVQKHYVRNSAIATSELLELCGALTCSQQRFIDLVEKVVDPVCRRGQSQLELVARLNVLLAADGFELMVVGEMSRHPVYGVKRMAAGVAGAPKNLIFAAINTKPDLYFTDAINKDVAIVNSSDALIYDRLLPEGGLTWTAMATWWDDHNGTKDLSAAKKALFKRLRLAVRAAQSPGENAIFQTYYSEFSKRLGDKLPALVPQVYLHYDPRTASQRGANQVLVRQRMDLLMLLDHGVRVVVEVDGKHHYADGTTASPTKYASMAVEDRRLRLLGYEVYRFGASEFPDAHIRGERFEVGELSAHTVVSFFEKLFELHPIRGADGKQ